MQKFNFILLVDDDKVTNFINRRVINKIGNFNKVEVALNGQQALEIIEKECSEGMDSPDVILLDINMPVKTGFDFLDQYKNSKYPSADKSKIIAVTTSSHQKDYEALRQYGIYDVIQKPLTEEKIRGVIERIGA
jgi:response regulator of citrate/malate metabolism